MIKSFINQKVIELLWGGAYCEADPFGIEDLAEQAFDDQCTGTNPRYPLIKDMKELYIMAYRGFNLESQFYHQPEELSSLG
ncbi:hypothetical protein [Cyanobacterium aponinum]|uniref:hypothetical protein n=1 Tax=Cyanobacterium aponinum TaxID=379064 RepID=UPI00167F3738|nr:hypothetical protein [Cyanobacterium aponinum]